MKLVYVGALVVAGLAGVGVFVRIPVEARSVPKARTFRAPPEDVGRPPRPLRLLFIHHSVGSHLLADHGPVATATAHPNGGGLRRLLEDSGYSVGSLTYGSRLGQRTDLFDWPDKFSKHLDELLHTAEQDRILPAGQSNDIVLFKSCFPNSSFTGPGVTPGNVQGPELTIENAKAALTSLLSAFQARPDELFVYLTAPPISGKTRPEPLLKWGAKLLLGRPTVKRRTAQAESARAFNQWVMDPRNGWLAGYPLKNVAAIDYYDYLTGDGASNFLAYPTGDGTDSHPSSDGQQRAAPRIVAAINAAASRAGLFVQSPPEPQRGGS